MIDSKDQALRLTWADNLLTISGPAIPCGQIEVNYLEAYCRAGSTNRDWGRTVYWHESRLLTPPGEPSQLVIETHVEDGVVVRHVLTAGRDEVDFRLEFHNPSATASNIHWAQPCVRVGRFVGDRRSEYVRKVFIFLDGRLARLPTAPWATEAIYTPGQVYCPRHVPRDDVNPRPLSELVPGNGLIGCFSADEGKILATAWEPYQELFQGVVSCIHSDIRIGGLSAGQTKRARGKIYVVPADVTALLRRYERDFPEHGEIAD